MSSKEYLQFLRNYGQRKGLQTFAKVTSWHQVHDNTIIETRYYISSLPNHAEKVLHAARSHWGVENTLHWIPDVTTGKDDSHVRKDNVPETMAALRRITLNLLKREKHFETRHSRQTL